MQFLEEPTFNQLRTIEQLGYVVFARKCCYRGVHGTQFIIQSPKESCEYIVNSLNAFLASMHEKVHSAEGFTEEDFKTQVESVLVQVGEKDFNLKMVSRRHWDEIAVTHTYMFDRQEREIQTLKELTRDSFLAHFDALFFNPQTTKRLDLELTSAKHTGSQIEWAGKVCASDTKCHVPTGTRQQVTKSVEQFKKNLSLFSDAYKAAYALE
jgi:insulysin